MAGPLACLLVATRARRMVWVWTAVPAPLRLLARAARSRREVWRGLPAARFATRAPAAAVARTPPPALVVQAVPPCLAALQKRVVVDGARAVTVALVPATGPAVEVGFTALAAAVPSPRSAARAAAAGPA